MNFIIWNCRGVGGKGFPTLIRDLRREFEANFIILLETHVNGDRGNKIREKMGFDGVFVEESRGHSGAIYGSPQRGQRKELWSCLNSISQNISSPWCIAGDFNAMLHAHERKGGSLNQIQGACTDFQTCVSECGLMDLGFSGWPFTWKRGNLFERLDRGLCNLDWQIIFPDVKVKHLAMMKSDHTPLLFQLASPQPFNRRRRPFRFTAAWLTHSDFGNVVKNNWSWQNSWSNCISNFQDAVRIWNSSVFGNIFFKKNRILRRLNGIATSLNLNSNFF
ncbi:uncharacterized protein LOC107486813 [Arachis duranensis]|uniref:Uncharacterized protein LOC107486813 n=1 Tax=Arachis duranensis TaxID=130453 RepID=A0A6P5NNL3_ARADU|nr:uncharacterized protein LOC107486813 [Arachis duranensis]